MRVKGAIYNRRAIKQFDADHPMIGFDIEAVAKLINLPDDHVMGPMGWKAADSLSHCASLCTWII